MKSDKKKDALLSMIRQGKPMTLGEQARLVMFLATPAILAQLTTTMMQYIDASWWAAWARRRRLPSD